MTFFEIKIETLNHQQVSYRVLKIPSKSSFNDLHLAIQIAFNLEMKESFEFIRHGVKYKLNPQIKECSSEESLEGLNEKEKFTYCYDALLQHHFELEILRYYEDETSSIELLDGNQNYWTELPYLKSIQKTTYSLKWINERLAALSQDGIGVYKQRFNQAIDRLNGIEYWQDYLHGLIVCFQFPMNHSVFIGAEACGKKVMLDFYFHQENFMKYLMCDHALAKKHLRKYQQLIQVCITSLSKRNCKAEVFYQGSLWESVLYKGILASFVEAVERLVKLIENLAFFHQKDSTNPFYLVDTSGNAYHEIQLLRKQEVKDDVDIDLYVHEEKRQSGVFEMDCLMDEDRYVLVCAGETFYEQRAFNHFSRHSVIQEIVDVFEKVGICEVLCVRDPWMMHLVQPLCEKLEIELKKVDTLDEIDERWKLKEVDAGFVKLDYFDLLKGKISPLEWTNKKMN